MNVYFNQIKQILFKYMNKLYMFFYVINDSRGKYKGKINYTGISGRYWKTSRLANMIIESVFGGNYINDYAYTFK